MMYSNKTKESGYSLVEVLISIAVLLITTVGPLSIATQGIRSAQFSLEQGVAYFLAQEGVEAIFAIRNNYALLDIDNDLTPGTDISWDWVVADTSNPYSIMRSDDGPCENDKLDNIGDSCTIGVEINGASDSYNNVSLIDCNDTNLSDCGMLLDETNNRAVYNHSSGNTTPFNRVIIITRESDNSIKVESKVTWDSNVFSTDQSVSVVTYLFDSNFEL